MKFCSECGSQNISILTPEANQSQHEVCHDCDAIFYKNPKIVAACILEWHNEILMCRRSIEPRKGMWTIPGGFMENGESVQEAALRETKEESGAQVSSPELFAIYNLKNNNQVYAVYCGGLVDGVCSAEHETEEVRLYKKDQIPWPNIAFLVIEAALRLYLENCKMGVVYQAKELTNGIHALSISALTPEE